MKSLALVTVIAGSMVLAPLATAKPPKHAVVKEGVGVAGVNLGMTQAQALAKWGKPDGKCNKSVGITPAFSSCSWTADKNQLVTIKAMKGKIVEIAMFGRLWKTSKGARGGKTTFGQLKKIYRGAKELNTCALDFGHIIEIGSGKHVTAFAGGYRTTDSDPFGYLTLYNSKATGGADGGPGRPLGRPQCGSNAPPPSGGGGGGGGIAPVTYTVSWSSGSGGSVAGTSSSDGANCNADNCSVKPGSSVTLTATASTG